MGVLWSSLIPDTASDLANELHLSLLLLLGPVPTPPHSFSLWDPELSYSPTKRPLNLDPVPPSSSSNSI